MYHDKTHLHTCIAALALAVAGYQSCLLAASPSESTIRNRSLVVHAAVRVLQRRQPAARLRLGCRVHHSQLQIVMCSRQQRATNVEPRTHLMAVHDPVGSNVPRRQQRRTSRNIHLLSRRQHCILLHEDTATTQTALRDSVTAARPSMKTRLRPKSHKQLFSCSQSDPNMTSSTSGDTSAVVQMH